MGVDAKIFVIADYGPYIAHAFSLDRDRDLWGPLSRCMEAHKHRKWPELQLPAGAHSTFSGGERPEGFENVEAGHIQDDCYGNALWAMKGKHLAKVKRDKDGNFPGWTSTCNDAVLTFIAEHFPDHDVVIWWH